VNPITLIRKIRTKQKLEDASTEYSEYVFNGDEVGAQVRKLLTGKSSDFCRESDHPLNSDYRYYNSFYATFLAIMT
jgi:hypothetical protein